MLLIRDIDGNIIERTSSPKSFVQILDTLNIYYKKYYKLKLYYYYMLLVDQFERN